MLLSVAMRLKLSLLLTFSSLLLFLAGWDRHDVLSLALLPSGEGAEVRVSARAYTPEESKAHLSRDLVRRGYQPIQVTICNNSPRTYTFSSARVGLDLVSAKEAAARVTRSALPRSLAYKLASVIFWPLAIPGTIDTIRTLKAHQALRRDFEAKAMKEEEEALPPYASVSRLLFVPQEAYTATFTVTLIDAETQEHWCYQTSAERT
jgi:hypothetical protein